MSYLAKWASKRSLLRQIGYAFACLTLLSTLNSAPAQEAKPSEDVKSLTNHLDDIERELRRGETNQGLLREWLKDIQATKQLASTCIKNTTQKQTEIQNDLQTLGPPVKGEPNDVGQQRKKLDQRKADTDARLASCRLLSLRSDDMADRVMQLQQQQLAQRLFARGPTMLELVQRDWTGPTQWFTATRSFVLEHSGIEYLMPTYWIPLAAVLVVALSVGLVVRRYASKVLAEQKAKKTFSSRFGQSSATVYAHYAPHLLATIAAALFFYFLTYDVTPVPFVSVVAYGLPAYFFLVTLIHIFLSPYPPAVHVHGIPDKVAKSLARRLKVLVLLVFIGYLIFTTLVAQSLPEASLLRLRAIFGAVFISNLIWIVWILGRIPNLARTKGLRTILTLFLMGILLAEWMGYRNLSTIALRAFFGTLIAFGIFFLIGRLVRELFDGLEVGRQPVLRKMRKALGLKSGEPVPGLGWVRLIIGSLIWGTFALVTLRIWGLSDTGFQQLLSFATTGFGVGSLRVVPEKIVFALVAFGILLAISGWFRKRLERKWLPSTRMERGAREAMVTISGYIGLAVAIFVALGIAGMNFGNLAIIAGALSVGIGFGLQNIVNNFVSGLILLFERPVKTGDWIVVGNTEGYVKRISIRSTQIQTFDRADVIVPNSELISNQVTNWMLHDPRGRVRLPVGVAYGSNTQLVKEILLGVAIDHPFVVNDGSTPEPVVLFRGFGDSSLDFELRCFIHNIDTRLTVISDLNFAIDAAFRQRGVEIPFPQRDLHVRDWPKDQASPIHRRSDGKHNNPTDDRDATE